MVMEVKRMQPAKHLSTNEVTEEGIVIEVKPLQPSKQPAPKEVTEEGMVIEVKPLHIMYLYIILYQLITC